jgi:hypothetical protein
MVIQKVLGLNPFRIQSYKSELAKAVGYSQVLSNALKKLKARFSVEKRIAIADSPDTSFEALQHLSQDENADLRFALAENHNIDKRILNTLTQDSNPYIAHRAQKTLDRLKNVVKGVITSLIPLKLVPTYPYYKKVKGNPSSTNDNTRGIDSGPGKSSIALEA